MVHHQGHSPGGHPLLHLDHIQASEATETTAEEAEEDSGAAAEETGSGGVEEEEECHPDQGEMTFTTGVALHLQDPGDHPWGVGHPDIEFDLKEEKVR